MSLEKNYGQRMLIAEAHHVACKYIKVYQIQKKIESSVGTAQFSEDTNVICVPKAAFLDWVIKWAYYIIYIPATSQSLKDFLRQNTLFNF